MTYLTNLAEHNILQHNIRLGLRISSGGNASGRYRENCIHYRQGAFRVFKDALWIKKCTQYIPEVNGFCTTKPRQCTHLPR